MKIGIVYYSHTGHTQRVVAQLASRLQDLGFNPDLLKLETLVPINFREARVLIKEGPAIDTDDALILATPVHGGRMCAPLRSFLDAQASLDGRQVACLATHFFRRGWGADQALGALVSACRAKGAEVLGQESVQWFSIRRKQGMHRAVEGISALFVNL